MTITKKIQYGILGVALLGVVAFAGFAAAPAHAQSIESLLEQIQALNEQIRQLQERLSGVAQERNELRIELRENLRQGMSDEDIKKVQELLATDPSIYPQGLVTGYFGPLTKEALKRFQARYELNVSGEIDSETHEYLEELLQERFGDRIPPGLLRAPGIHKKVELRLIEGCDNSGKGKAPFCKKLKIKYGDDDANDDANDDDANDDANDDEDEMEVDEIRVVIDGDEAVATVEYENGDEDTFEYDTTDEAEIIALLADELDMDEEDVEDVIEFEDESDNIDYIRVEFDGDDSDVEVKHGNGTIETFTLDNVTRHNDVIEGIAEELDIDEDDVRENIEFLDGELVIQVTIDDNDSEVDITYENGDHESFFLDETDEDDIIDEIADRTGLTEDEIEDVIEFN